MYFHFLLMAGETADWRRDFGRDIGGYSVNR